MGGVSRTPGFDQPPGRWRQPDCRRGQKESSCEHGERASLPTGESRSNQLSSRRDRKSSNIPHSTAFDASGNGFGGCSEWIDGMVRYDTRYVRRRHLGCPFLLCAGPANSSAGGADWQRRRLERLAAVAGNGCCRPPVLPPPLASRAPVGGTAAIHPRGSASRRGKAAGGCLSCENGDGRNLRRAFRSSVGARRLATR